MTKIDLIALNDENVNNSLVSEVFMKTCPVCKKEFEGKHISIKIYCSRTCAKKNQNIQHKLLNPRHSININKVGVLSEMLVCCDLLKKNCDVYRQLAANICDLAIIYKDKFLKVEVTTGSKLPHGNYYYPRKDRSKFDILAIVVNGEITYEPDIFKDQT